MKPDQEIRSLFEPLPAPELLRLRVWITWTGIACCRLVALFRGTADASKCPCPGHSDVTDGADVIAVTVRRHYSRRLFNRLN